MSKTPTLDSAFDELLELALEAKDNLRGAESAADVRYAKEQLTEAKTALKQAVYTALVEQQIPVMALTAKKPHREVQIQAIPPSVLSAVLGVTKSQD